MTWGDAVFDDSSVALDQDLDCDPLVTYSCGLLVEQTPKGIVIAQSIAGPQDEGFKSSERLFVPAGMIIDVRVVPVGVRVAR